MFYCYIYIVFFYRLCMYVIYNNMVMSDITVKGATSLITLSSVSWRLDHKSDNVIVCVMETRPQVSAL